MKTTDKHGLATIKTVHTFIWFGVELCLAYLLYAGISRRPRRIGVAGSVVFGEVLIFASNGFRCPLTKIADKLGAEHASITDIYLPRWLARNLPAIHVPLLMLTAFLHWRKRQSANLRP